MRVRERKREREREREKKKKKERERERERERYLDGKVRSLDLDRVEKSRRASHQRPARKRQFGQGVEATLIQTPCPVLDSLSAFKMLGDVRVVFPPLKLLIGVDVPAMVGASDERWWPSRKNGDVEACGHCGDDV